MAHEEASGRLTRRQLLRMSGALVASSLLAACGGTAAPATETPAAQAPTAAAASPQAAQPTAAPVAQPPAQQTSATVVVMHLRHELTEDQEKQFEAANPGIQIEFLEADPTRFFAMYSAGNPPDLLRVQAPDIPQYLARNMLLDLTPYFETSNVLRLDDLAPANNYYKANSPLEIGQGKIYGMCKDWSPDFTLFAYTKAFTDVGLDVPSDTQPLTYQQLMELARKLTKREGDRITMWGFGHADWVDRNWMNMLAETGQSLFSPDFTRMNLVNNPEARKVVQYYFDLAKENLVANPLNPSPSWNGEDFTKGTVGIVQWGYWFSAMAESEVTKGQVIMLPAPTWAGQRRDPTVTATGMIMSAKTKVPDAAWKVFEWYNGREPAIERAKSGWGVPALKSMYNLMPQETEFQKQAQKVLQAELKYTDMPIQFNPYIGANTVTDSWTKNLDQALRGTISFDQLLENVEKEVNTAIQEGRDRIG